VPRAAGAASSRPRSRRPVPPPTSQIGTVHIAAEPDTGPITACGLTAGNTGDAEAAAGLLESEPAGTEVLGDSAYGTGELRHHLAEQDMCAVQFEAVRQPVTAA
jgi:Transposase DDE domain